MLMLTRRGDVVYAHLLRAHEGDAVIRLDKRPQRVVLLADGQEVAFAYRRKELRVSLPAGRRDTPDAVLKIIP